MVSTTFVNQLWRKKKSDVMSFLLQIRAWEYRHLPAIYKINKPTRIEKARRLGYKSKKGFIVYRVKVRRGGRKKQVRKGITNGKPKNHGINEQKFNRNKKSVAEERIGKICGNLRVLNSYWINQDSIYKYFEVILIDPFHKNIKKDIGVRWICSSSSKHREMRGLTSSGRKGRGLRRKGHRANKARPSTRASWKRRNLLSLKRFR
ncbi:60S ribosomal protein L15 (nucleomorph) [Chroomonas mesostigmatica CCMP1168]|uniref:Ribosomal protein L15 n=1 Tax=Chroomonas mesostigmatica CCMP1168 TaxID=1195612 RepID=J7G7N2_9CRYP|nr:60S ribosomal protein L15 [Chroomonas mesostigmatica CCMP1168]|mmetsp:Transcript_16785/g.41026  ORF Transcript_16785/g.41026 Transcript_16785/m.41026 type:complete len:205 (-) Transcript_16785:881-1495(-)